MELQKKSELTVGRTSFVISTGLAGDAAPAIETKVLGGDGAVVFQTSQDISALKPIFQNSQKVFARMEAQHLAVVKELQQGRIPESGSDRSSQPSPSPGTAEVSLSQNGESDALAHAVDLLGTRNFDKAASALRAVLQTYPNCSEARELLEVSYKAASSARLPVELGPALKRGTEAFTSGRQRDAIESWKQCLVEEPENRRLQLLVLLATTWSQDRRQEYAAEVLTPGNRLLNGGRAEEVQALLLVTQTVEGAQSPPASALDATAVLPTSPPTTHAPLEETAVLEAPSFEEMSVPDASDLESLVSDYAEDEIEVVEPPVEPVKPVQRVEPVKPVQPVESVAPVRVASPVQAAPTPPPAPPRPAPPAQASPSPKPASPAPRPAQDPETKEHLRVDPRSAAPAARSAPGRRPPVPRSSPPWGIIGAAVAGVVVLGGVSLWLFSGDGSVPPERVERAASLVSSAQYSLAIAEYDALLDEFGDHAEILLGRGRAKLASADTGGGLADLERAYALDPTSSAIAEEIADVFYSQGNYTGAIEYYGKAFQGGAGTAEGRYRYAVGLVRQDRGNDAIEHLRSAITKDSAHGEAQFLLGQLLNVSGQYEEAERALRAAESHVEAGSDFLAQLGVALLEQQKLDQAEEIARDFIRSYPSDARGRSLLGEVYLNRRQYEPARAQLILALRTNPREPRAQLALGRTWLAIGKSRNDAQDLGKAQQVLAAAQGVHEGQRLLVLGQVALAEGNLPKAQSLLEQSLSQGAPALSAHLSLAETKWKANDLVGAAEELHRAYGLSTSDPAISLSLAITYFQLKEPTRAADEFLKALQGIGLVVPPGPDAGPVVLPAPYVPLPDRFDVNRAIRESVQAVLKTSADDPTATQLQTLSASTTFVLGNGS